MPCHWTPQEVTETPASMCVRVQVWVWAASLISDSNTLRTFCSLTVGGVEQPTHAATYKRPSCTCAHTCIFRGYQRLDINDSHLLKSWRTSTSYERSSHAWRATLKSICSDEDEKQKEHEDEDDRNKHAEHNGGKYKQKRNMTNCIIIDQCLHLQNFSIKALSGKRTSAGKQKEMQPCWHSSFTPSQYFTPSCYYDL